MSEEKQPEYKEFETHVLQMDQIYPNDWNPNVQKDAVFNALVANIQELGFVEPIMVSVRAKEDDPSKKYMIISGEHRYEACKVLGFETIPAIVREDFDEDMEKFMTVRMNVLKGELDPIKFTKMFDNLAKKYSDEMLKDLMGFVDENAFQNVYKDVKKGLPKKLRKKLDDTKDEIQNVDDLSRVLNELFSKYGDTLDQNFMVFTYGGKVHLWVLMTNNLKKKIVDDIVPTLGSKSLDMSVFMELLIGKYGDEIQEEMISRGVGSITDVEDDDDDEETTSSESETEPSDDFEGDETFFDDEEEVEEQ